MLNVKCPQCDITIICTSGATTNHVGATACNAGATTDATGPTTYVTSSGTYAGNYYYY